MDPKYFILILFCGHLNNTFFSPIKAITTEKQPQSTLLSSSVSYVLANSQNPTGNPLGQPTPTAKVSAGQPTAVTSSGKAAAQTSAGHTPAYNTTRQPTSVANTSSQQTAQPVLTSSKQLSTFAHTSTRHPQPLASTSIQQPPSVHTSSRKPVPPTMKTPSIQATPPADERPPGITPGFITGDISITQTPHKTDHNYIAAIIVGVFLVSMLVATIMMVLCKCLRKPVLNDRNWAGRSPFADGETPDMCMDNIRENEAPTKRTSIISLMTWRPNKNTLLADDLEIKLFESSENIEDSNNSQTEKTKDQVNGTSEESAGGSTIGTAISSSDDADLPPPPPQLLDLEGEERNQSDKPAMTILSPIPNDSTSLPPSLGCVDQICEEHNSEFKESFPPPPDSLNLPLPPEDVMKTLEDSNNEIQCQEISILPNADQDLSEPLPPPPEELL
ncbi:ecotropic viral integration site 2B [Phyllostomus discolor]|uniref:Ecotropic viral integration site 2B n=1 Tax=Phyllostomus discolor TaxID=89673 RepID=A0A6J2M5G3_9CHIR|nr:protein EVI2B [Phyllostomus discolor]XP_035889278.1 protein EVI2B [Phyllostomus discolor]XP_035889279.1 protein EVI2B [Phyllostomus discolor]XP_035889280.1 protein EVI2B [Phyllostomus discolor]KAF6093630.1 ecotropic viral integration site 2B [Phyllostomus discolor]